MFYYCFSLGNIISIKELVHTPCAHCYGNQKKNRKREGKPSKGAHSLGTIVCLRECYCAFYILLFALLKPILIYLIYVHHSEQKYFVSIFIYVDIIHVSNLFYYIVKKNMLIQETCTCIQIVMYLNIYNLLLISHNKMIGG